VHWLATKNKISITAHQVIFAAVYEYDC
jgi:hypothetical protein